ncbi:MAG: D-alanyl-D-alanine carboxypeptidase family protein [Pseudomonadota bacterium]
MLSLLRASALSLGLAVLALPVHAFDTSARAAYVIDQTTGTVLLSKEADQPLPPASMSKLMTLYVAFEALRDGRLTLQEILPVSEHAMSYGGSTMFLNTQDRVTVEDLLRGIIVLSGNDACFVIAEALSPDGTEAGFARYMTQRAQQLGMNNSNFANSNGWPAAGHMMSVHDLAVLADRLITDFPEYYPLFAEEEFEFDGRAPSNKRNRNPLLRLDIGADGLKTGHTQEAGYGLVGSAKQGDRRVIFVLSGIDTTGQRAEEAEAVVNWSFRNFVERTVATEETPIAEAKLWMGEKKTVGLVPEGDLTVLFPVLGTQNVEAEVVYEGPINAPVAKGQQLAELVIKPEGLPEIRRPLVAAENVALGGFVVRMMTVGGIVLKDFINNPLESM